MSSTEEIVEDSLTESRTESTEDSKKVLLSGLFGAHYRAKGVEV